MLLSAGRIYELVNNTAIPLDDRLVITPVLNWKAQAKSGTCAIDVRLGQRFRVPRRARIGMLDHLSEKHKRNIELYTDDHHVFLGDYFVLHPRQFVLGETLEWVRFPRGYAAYVMGRSSWGRDGLIIATATGVHANYTGVLTLELTNVGEIPIRLYPGLTIAQLFIHTVDVAEDVTPEVSPFAGSTAPRSADAVGSQEKAILTELRKLGGYDDD